MNEKRYYWLKLPKDYFKRHDIKFIKTLPNGRDIALFYLELMAESVDHEGTLRFSPERPYTDAMLAAVTDTPLEIVEMSMKTLKEFDLVQVSEDGTIILPKVLKMIGTAGDNDNARRQQRYRDRKKAEKQASVTDNVTDNVTVTTNSNESIEKEIEIEKELEIDTKRESKERKSRSHFVPPTVEEVYDYCEERHNGIDPMRFVDYYSARGWKNITDWKAQVRVWESKVGIPASEF